MKKTLTAIAIGASLFAGSVSAQSVYTKYPCMQQTTTFLQALHARGNGAGYLDFMRQLPSANRETAKTALAAFHVPAKWTANQSAEHDAALIFFYVCQAKQ